MTDVTTSVDLDAWQIGSSGPPAICLCCGSKFNDDTHRRRGPYLEMPYIWVCQWCWEKPYLFFPDKVVPSPPETSGFVETSGPPRSTRDGGSLQLSIVPERTIKATLVYRKVSALRFDVKNPRLRHLGKIETEEDVEKLLWKEPSTKTLFREIEYTQGLSTPLLIDNQNVVREGNRRLVCLRKLVEKIVRGDSDMPLFKIRKIPCYVLPVDAKEEDIALYLTLEHVTGKKEWRPVNQAAHVFDLHNAYNLPFPRISEIIGRSQSTLRVMERAYRATLEYHELYPDDSGWMGKYSYFFEAYRHRQTVEWLAVKGNMRRLARWINTGKISKGAEIRNLQLIIGDSASSNRMQLTRDQRESDKHLISLTRQTREMLSLMKQGRLTKEALEAIRDLRSELTKFIDQNNS